MLSKTQISDIYWKLNSLRNITENILYDRMSKVGLEEELAEIDRLMEILQDERFVLDEAEDADRCCY